MTVRAADSAGETGRSSRGVTVLPIASIASPAAPKRLGDVYLACGSRSVALVDVAVSGRRVKLTGAALKLTRRLRFTSVKAAKGQVTLAGRATGRFGKRGAHVIVRRRVSCAREAVAGKGKIGRAGMFRVVLALPAGVDPALYRATIKVRRSSTFTLPRAISP